VPRHLVAILHSPPLGDGARTLARVTIARDALGCDSASIANLYAAPLANVNAFESSPHGGGDAWKRARILMRRELARADATDVLLAYGVQSPSGDHRLAFAEQLSWLHHTLERTTATVWTFGGRPYHPSRWQRVTHRHEPGTPVEALAARLLVPRAHDVEPG